MKYKSSMTGEVWSAIIILLIYLLVNTWTSLESNGARYTVFFSACIFLVAVIIIFSLVRGTYLVVENGMVKYVHTFLQREKLEIANVSTIQKGIIGGIFSFMFLTYEDRGKIRHMRISPLTFKKTTLKQFVSEIKKSILELKLTNQLMNLSLESN